MKVITHSSIDDFKSFNEDYLNKNFYATIPLVNVFEMSIAENRNLSACFNIYSDEQKNIICIAYPPMVLMYGSSWDKEMITELQNRIPFNSVHNKLISGCRQLVLDYLEGSSLEANILRERIVYKCEECSVIKEIAPGAMLPAIEKDIDLITQMAIEFRLEEFGPNTIHNYTDMRMDVIRPGIESRTIYKWVNGGKIHSIAQVILHEDNSPEIGLFYTNPASRGNGYGLSLLHTLTSKMLRDFEDCGLQAMRDNETSNHVFRKIGYNAFYDWIKIEVIEKNGD